MTHPVDSVYVNGAPVAKPDVRAYEASRGILVLSTATEIQTLTITTTTVVCLDGVLFRYDVGDLTSAHDGVNVLVSANGKRYKRVAPLSDLTGAMILDVLADGDLPIAKIEPGDPNTLFATKADSSRAWITGADVADMLDAALGSANWRTGSSDIALGTLVKHLPANAMSGMIGGRFRMAQMADSTVRVAGASSGQFNGTSSNSGTMRRIGFPPGFVLQDGKIYAGCSAGYAIDADDYPWSWGDNQFGALGHGDTIDRAAPKRIEWFVANSFKVAEIVPIPPGSSEQNYGAFFLEKGGSGRVAYAGHHGNGAAGDGSAAGGNKTTPVLVSSLTNVTYLFASNHPITALARRSDGSWRGWGANVSSCLGIAGTDFTTPQTLSAMAGWVKAVCSGTTTLALTAAGAAKTAGGNAYGSLGVGNTTTLSGWQDPLGLSSDVLDIAITRGEAASCAVKQLVGGFPTAKFWGRNATGLVGDGSTATRASPYAPVAPWQGSVTDIILASVNGDLNSYSAAYVRCGDAIHAAGYNATSNLAVGITGNVSTFTEVIGHAGTILEWAVMGYFDQYGPILLTDRGCFSGGANGSGDAGIGPTFVNAPTLQDLWIPGVMGFLAP